MKFQTSILSLTLIYTFALISLYATIGTAFPLPPSQLDTNLDMNSSYFFPTTHSSQDHPHFSRALMKRKLPIPAIVALSIAGFAVLMLASCYLGGVYGY
jgi:hypothetical protein